MGNKVVVGIRGNDNVLLTNWINEVDDSTFEKVIKQLGDKGTIVKEEVKTKFDLIQQVNVEEGEKGVISAVEKDAVIERVLKGTFFDE